MSFGCKKATTVGEMIRILQEYPADMPLRCPYWDTYNPSSGKARWSMEGIYYPQKAYSDPKIEGGEALCEDVFREKAEALIKKAIDDPELIRLAVEKMMKKSGPFLRFSCETEEDRRRVYMW
jgi:hypothetical protein